MKNHPRFIPKLFSFIFRIFILIIFVTGVSIDFVVAGEPSLGPLDDAGTIERKDSTQFSPDGTGNPAAASSVPLQKRSLDGGKTEFFVPILPIDSTVPKKRVVASGPLDFLQQLIFSSSYRDPKSTKSAFNIGSSSAVITTTGASPGGISIKTSTTITTENGNTNSRTTLQNGQLQTTTTTTPNSNSAP